jgi:uncharacterized protein DUF4845
MRTICQQRGLSSIATLAIIILVGFGLFLLFKLVPVYLEYFNVASSVNSLKEVDDLGQKSPEEVRELLKRRMDINDVKRVKPDNIKITRAQNTTTVTVNYEARVPLLGNIDLICTFAKTAVFR